MKNNLLLTAVLLITLSVPASLNAQIQQGNWLVGGSLSFGFNGESSKDGSTRTDVGNTVNFNLV
ncbi:MAG: hypothetical protein WBA74_21530, partial [Cyclobacteriaceae bacterium]